MSHNSPNHVADTDISHVCPSNVGLSGCNTKIKIKGASECFPVARGLTKVAICSFMEKNKKKIKKKIKNNNNDDAA